jgi:two-component system sensor histidine kinase UhpB
LVAALQWYVQEFERRYGIQTEFTVEGNRVRLPAEYETVLFRVVQEGLTNVAKHAQATHATVKLEIQPTQVCVDIYDDGRGFEPEQVLRRDSTHIGWGLLGIQERTSLLGGQYEITSDPGSGTSIRVRVPLVMEKKDVENTLAVG